MYSAIIHYEDGTVLNFSNINKVGYWSAGGFITLKDAEIINHPFSLNNDYILFSETSCASISRQGLRCIDISKK